MAAELIDDAVNELKNNTAKLKALREHFHSYDSEPPYPIDWQIRENEALIARAEGGTEPVTEAERAALRAEQAARVMPLIGPLLDAWDGLPNDIRSLVRDEHPELGTHLNQIAAAVEGDR
ncbi:hypothetical protein CCR97_08020 [Rhodoplanes elegans]|nr:hypothetical protein [Rhodoplanes elegans]MBK5958157.1 hypothetical protein [Rhodoplanes elegans]